MELSKCNKCQCQICSNPKCVTDCDKPTICVAQIDCPQFKPYEEGEEE